MFMRSKLLVPMLATAVLGLAACGSSKSSSTTSTSPAATTPATTTTTTTTAHKKAKKHTKAAAAGIPSRTYRLALKGSAETPAGAPKGTGKAVVTLRGKSLRVCWRFSSLHGFSHATAAHIHVGAAGTSGNVVVPLSTGKKFLHSGCAPTTATLIKAIAANPHGYYVNIHSTKYPNGAVRSQL
jgi:hypothetical protein